MMKINVVLIGPYIFFELELKVDNSCVGADKEKDK